MPNSCRTIIKKCLHKGAINQKEYEKLMRKMDFMQDVRERLNSDPCLACKWYPPSSFDGKPCTMCPAEGKETEKEFVDRLNDDAPTTGTHVEVVKRIPDVYDALEDYVTDNTHVDVVMRMIADIWEKTNPGYKFVYEIRSVKIWNTPIE